MLENVTENEIRTLVLIMLLTATILLCWLEKAKTCVKETNATNKLKRATNVLTTFNYMIENSKSMLVTRKPLSGQTFLTHTIKCSSLEELEE